MINISSQPPVPCSGGLGPRWIFWVWVSEKIYHHSLCRLIQTNMLLLQLAALLASNFELIYMGKQTKCMMIWCWCIWRRMASITLFYLLTCAVWSVCAFINSDRVLNNEGKYHWNKTNLQIHSNQLVLLATKLVIVPSYLHSELVDYCLLVYMYIFDWVTMIPSQQMVKQ